MEDVYAIELEEITELSTSVSVDKALLKALEAMYTINYSARTVNRLYLLLISEKFTSLSIIYRVVKSVYYASVLTPGMSLAARCERISKHDLTSINVARPRVNLNEPDAEISVFVRFNKVLIGVNTTGKSLHREKSGCIHPIALKTVLAVATLRLCEYRGELLLNPLCDESKILSEAAHMARKYPVVLLKRNYYFTKLPLHDLLTESATR